MKTLLRALKQKDQGGMDEKEVFLQLGAARFDFITYGDGTFAVRRQRGGLMSPCFKINWVQVKVALNWIDNNSEPAQA